MHFFNEKNAILLKIKQYKIINKKKVKTKFKIKEQVIKSQFVKKIQLIKIFSMSIKPSNHN